MKIVSWKSGVNRIIENSTNTSLGVNALRTSKTENGSEQASLTSTGVPNQYSVNMTFSNSTQDSFYKSHFDENGHNITEWMAFQRWFKKELGYGTNAFYFASINDVSGETSAIYKIVGSGLPKGNPNGQYMKVTMTWAEYFPTPVTLTETSNNADYLDIVNGQIEYHFDEVPETTPVKSDFLITYIKNELPEDDLVIERLEYDGYKTCILYYQAFVPPLSDEDTYNITVTYSDFESLSRILTVSADE